jgi:phosphoribosyl-AMP cyclohydrolase
LSEKKSAFERGGGFLTCDVVILQHCRRAGASQQVGDLPEMSDLSTAEREQGEVFAPKFDEKGLLSAIAVDSRSREILMVAFMDAQALAKTRESGLAHFHSRSRGRLWMKGETSGHVLKVEEMRVDCDQDAVVMLVRPEGPACHTGENSCFYRRLDGETLTRIG